MKHLDPPTAYPGFPAYASSGRSWKHLETHLFSTFWCQRDKARDLSRLVSLIESESSALRSVIDTKHVQISITDPQNGIKDVQVWCAATAKQKLLILNLCKLFFTNTARADSWDYFIIVSLQTPETDWTGTPTIWRPTTYCYCSLLCLHDTGFVYSTAPWKSGRNRNSHVMSATHFLHRKPCKNI